MKITHIQTLIVKLPDDEPLANGPAAKGATRDFVTLTMGTDAGIEGLGATFFGGALTGALRVAVQTLGELTVGMDPLKIEAVLAKLRAAAGQSGPGGIFTLALSAIDIALWDIKGKALNLPLSKLLGGSRDKVPTYASGALMRHFPLDHLLKAGPTLVKNGFKQMKTQLALPGDTNPQKEVERIRLLREAIPQGGEHQHRAAGRSPPHAQSRWQRGQVANEDSKASTPLWQVPQVPTMTARGGPPAGATSFRPATRVIVIGRVLKSRSPRPIEAWAWPVAPAGATIASQAA